MRRTQLCRDPEEDHAEAEDQEAVLAAEAEASAAVAEADSAEDIEDVFPKTISSYDIFVVIVSIGLIILAVFLIVKLYKKSKEKNDDDGSYKGSSERINFDNL